MGDANDGKDHSMRQRNRYTQRALPIVLLAIGLALLVSWLAWQAEIRLARPAGRDGTPREPASRVVPRTIPAVPPGQPGGATTNARGGNGNRGGTAASSLPPPTTPTLAILSSSPEETVAEIRFPAPVITPVTYHGRQAVTVTMAHCQSLKGVDQPALPVQRWELAIPTGAQASIEITQLDSYMTPSDPPVPSGGFGLRTASRPEGEFGETYQGTTPYPTEIAELSASYLVRSIEGTGVIVHPVRYLPAEEALEVVRSVQVRVRYTPANATAALRYPAAPASRAFRQLASSRYANYSETIATTSSVTTRTDGAFTGTDTLLVIMPDAWAGQFDDFLVWKRQRGLEVLTALYPSDTGETTTELAAYIQNAYDASDIAYVLFLGDEDAIPTSQGTRTDASGNKTPSDTVYALVAGDDSYHDLLLSRVSVTTAARAATVLDKYLAYERDPDTTEGWHASGMMVASNIDNTSTGDTVYLNNTDSDDLDLFRADLTDSGLFTTVNQVYQGTTEGSTAKISSYWNAGRSLVYYLGHGSETSWTSVTFSTANAAALTNGTMLPYVVSGACLNGAFQENDPCLAEAMLWGTEASGQGGALAVVASTNNMSWDPPIAMLDAFTGYYLGQSSFDVGSFLSVSGQAQLWDAGGLAFASIQRAMDYCVEADSGTTGTYEMELIMQQTQLFGDCTAGVRTVTPQSLTVSHESCVLPLAEGLTVTVADPDGAAVEGAVVTLLDDSGNQAVGTTDESGETTLSGSLFTPGGTVTLTVYERDSIPVQETAFPVNDGSVVIRTWFLPTGFVGESCSQAIVAAMGTTPYAWTLTSGSLPGGIALDATTGTLAGTPASTGEYTFSLTVTDNNGDTDTQAFSWTIGQPVQIADQTLAEGTVGTAYSATISASGDFTPFSFALAGGSLPPGLSLDPEGNLSGTPAVYGAYSFTVAATDSERRTAEATVSLTVQASDTITITTTALPTGEVGVAYSVQLEATGGTGSGLAWALLSGELPDGLSLGDDGLLAGTPTTTGTSTVTVQVADDADVPHTASAEFSVTVGQAVAFGNTALPSGTVGYAYSEELPTTGSYTPFTFSATSGEEYVQSIADSTFSAGGTLQSDWYGDEVNHTLSLGFDFPFFGQTYNTCQVADNGYLIFGDAAPTTGDSAVYPDASWNAESGRLDDFHIIAPCWADLLIVATTYPDTGIWLTQTSDSITICWRGRDYDHTSYVLNFSVTLHATGEIVFHYGTIQTSNRVVIGLGDASDHDSVLIFSQIKDGTGASAYSNSDDLVFTPEGSLPDGLTLSSGGVLSGTPTTAGSYSFLATVTDAEGNTDAATFAINILEVADPDTNSDGDVSSTEILAYIERWHAGEVTEAEVEDAVALWQAGPTTSRVSSASRGIAVVARTRVRVAYGDRAMLDRIIAQGLDIASVHDGQAWIYVSSSERAWLEDQGLTCIDAPRSSTRSSTTYTYAELSDYLDTLASTYPSLCRVAQIGTSVEGNAMLALVLSDHPYLQEDEPEVRISGGIHGDERLGVGLSVRLAEWLLQNYGGEDADGLRATNLLDTTELWIVPLLNPDGYSAVPPTRENSNGQDLNRLFPDGFLDGVSTVYAEGAPDTSNQEAEQAAMMEWTASHRFVLGANLHTGAQLVCYPYGNSATGASQYSASPDNDLFIDIAQAYANNHSTMATTGTFAGGIINSCDWYAVVGEFADWAYRYTGSLEVTVELDTDDDPDVDLAWTANEEALLSFAESAQQGLRGVVVDADTGDPVSAVIAIDGNERQVFTDPAVGDYHRLLLPDTYSVTVSATGYVSQTFTDVVVSAGDATRLDVALASAADSLQATRTFSTLLFEPDAENTVGIEVDLDEASPPHAFIVSETLPDAWTYVSGSALETSSGTALATPRIEGQTVQWLFWRDEVQDRSFTYVAQAPADGDETVLFGGSLRTADTSMGTGGDSEWLAHTSGRFAVTMPAGWSLLSLPITPADSLVADVFGDADISIWAWDAASLCYRTPTDLSATEGYWVYAAEETPLIVEGTAPVSGTRGFPFGWNLFGPLADRDLLDDSIFDSDTLEWSSGEYLRAVQLQCGKGYWIHAGTSGEATVR